MDTKVNSALLSYRKTCGLPDDISEQTAFEYFSTYCVTYRFANGNEDPDAFSVGKAAGIDAIVISIQGQLVKTLEEAKAFLLNGSTVTYRFIQSKTSQSLDLGDFLKFTAAVEGFFGTPGVTEGNEFFQECLRIKDYIEEHFVKLSDLPSVVLLYAFPGDWSRQSENWIDSITKAKESLLRLNMFHSVDVQGLDSASLFNSFRHSQMQVKRTINVPKRIAYPPAGGVNQASLCLVAATEYLKLITNEDDNLMLFLYNDNVRDFLGENPVNSEIARTLAPDSDLQDKFGIFNNGVTIVAKKVGSQGDLVSIEDYQIVNGCQTSTVLFENRHNLSDKSFVAVKLIETDDIEIINKVVRATNRQTQVTDEAFIGLSEYQKGLELFYESQTEPVRLYYERRLRQHLNRPDVAQYKVVSISVQVKSFLAVFLGAPHSCHRYYGEIVRSNRDNIFTPRHNEAIYYCSAAVYYLVEQFFWRNNVQEWRPYKWHLCMLIREFLAGKLLPAQLLDRKKMGGYCQDFIKTLGNNDEFEQAAFKAMAIIRTVSNRSSYTKDGNPDSRLSSFTQDLLKELPGYSEVKENRVEAVRIETYRPQRASVSTERVGSRLSGTVVYIHPQGWGKIVNEKLDDVWFSLDVWESEVDPKIGDRVTFNYYMGSKGWRAYAVTS